VSGLPRHSPLPGGLTLVIPSRNEASSLGFVVREWWVLRPSNVPFQILVVDDASDDDSPRILESLKSEVPLTWIRNPTRLGFGGSLREGIRATTTPFVAFTDADGQYDPRDLPKLLDAVAAGSDLALGCRSRRADPSIRIVISVGFRALLYVLFGLRLKDPTTSLKAGRTETIRLIAQRVRYMNGSFWNEFMLRWTRAGLALTEVGVRHGPRRDGQSKVASRAMIVQVAIEQLFALVRTWREFHQFELDRPSNPATFLSRP
jgi:glycosyltransferase involved in cell wall biosynthesis